MEHNMHEMEHETSGMDMHDAHEIHEEHNKGGQTMHMHGSNKRLIISLFFAIPIILLSPMMGISLPFQLELPGSERLVLVLATILFIYGGMPFFKGAVMEIKNKKPAMMTLITLGITVAYVYSLFAFINNHFLHQEHKMDFFWEMATLIVIMLFGHWIEMRAVGNAGNALQKMASLLPGNVHLIMYDDEIEDIPLSDLQTGQQVLVKPGEKIPADGIVISGMTSVNESMLTGEALGVKKEMNSKVIGGSVNGDGTIQVKVTATGKSSYLAQVIKMVNEAQQEKSKTETISDKVAGALFYVALLAGIASFIVWYILADVNIALERMVTVFVIACPHALGLAIPLVVARCTSIAARHGLLIRNQHALEMAKKISVVCMDKTGTLTEGNFKVTAIKSLSDKWDENKILSVAAALENGSNHPLSTGVLQASKEHNVEMPKADKITQINGIGLSGVINGENVKIVSVAYLPQHQAEHYKEEYEQLTHQGYTVSYLLVEEVAVALIAQGDQIKYEAKETVAELKKQHILPVMLTGDNSSVANKIAKQLGIDKVHASLLPDTKEKIIVSYQVKGNRTMMVGDGINDAPALVRSDIGVAIGAGTDIAIDSADVILVKSDPKDIIHFLSLAKNTMRKMVQNLWWGAGYNIIAIPLAAGVLAPMGITLSPAVGAILMSASTVIVAINALTLKMKK